MQRVLYLCVVSFYLHLCWGASINLYEANVHHGAEMKALVFLGRSGGKSFFLERRGMTRAAAIQFCEDMRMRLATIETQGELDVLMNVPFAPGVIHGWHWISNHFVWDSSSNNLPKTIPWNTEFMQIIPEGKKVCGIFQYMSDSRGAGLRDCCAHDGYVICEARA